MVEDLAKRGSSPLTRGGLISTIFRSAASRLIPAYAGRTSSLPPPTPPTAAHPRLRGADVSASLSATACVGSSPLTRGGPGFFLLT